MPPKRDRPPTGQSSQRSNEGIDIIHDIRQAFVEMRQVIDQVQGETAPQPQQEKAQSMHAANETKARTYMLDFQSLDPPKFNGSLDPLEAKDWLWRIDFLLNIMQVKEEDLRVSMASFQLIGEAAIWWRMVRGTANVAKFTWDDFKNMFLDRYFPSVVRDAKRAELCRLVQGNMTVAQYESKFITLACYAPEIVSTEAIMARMFEQGLRPAIRSRISILRLMRLQEVVERATMVEKDMEDAEREERHGVQFRGQGKKRQREEPSATAATGQQGLNGQLVCYHCGQPGHRKSECPLGGAGEQGTCYHCGLPGHRAKDCCG